MTLSSESWLDMMATHSTLDDCRPIFREIAEEMRGLIHDNARLIEALRLAELTISALRHDLETETLPRVDRVSDWVTV